jgi:signal transduction histidine kinase
LNAVLTPTAGVLLLTQEAFQPDFVQALVQALAQQPTWSNLPLVLLVDTPQPQRFQASLIARFGPDIPLTLLTRPVPSQTLVSVLQTNVWLRQRQYEVQRLLVELMQQNARLQESEDRLQALNATLEQQVETRTAQVRALAAELTMAEQEERRRISQILHDELQQQLYASKCA